MWCLENGYIPSVSPDIIICFRNIKSNSRSGEVYEKDNF
jgi:hypothetical protein